MLKEGDVINIAKEDQVRVSVLVPAIYAFEKPKNVDSKEFVVTCIGDILKPRSTPKLLFDKVVSEVIKISKEYGIQINVNEAKKLFIKKANDFDSNLPDIVIPEGEYIVVDNPDNSGMYWVRALKDGAWDKDGTQVYVQSSSNDILNSKEVLRTLIKKFE